MKKLFAAAVILVIMSVPIPGFAGDPDWPGYPSAGSGMYTLLELYNYLNSGTVPSMSTSFQEPSAGPGSTMKTTKNIYDDIKAKFDACDAQPSDVASGIKFFSTLSGNWGMKTGSGLISSGDAGVGDVLSGKTFSNTSSAGLTGTMTNNGAGGTITPAPASQTVAAGYWSSDNTVSGDPNLQSSNIRSEVTIFGVSGDSNVVNTSSGDAISSEIMINKKAWVDGSEITGSVTAGSDVSGGDGSKTFTIPDGLYSGSKEATATDSALTVGNIKKDVVIFGVTGTYEATTYNAGVAKTGQTTSYATGDDGDLEEGVAWPNPRFTDNSNGTVTDNLTGLMWTKNANAAGEKTWANALTYCNSLSLGGYSDWRLPNEKELLSLIDFAFVMPALSNAAGTAQWDAEVVEGDPFTDVKSNTYWSSTTYADATDNKFTVSFWQGYVAYSDKANSYNLFVWPVRGGQ